MSNKFYRLSIAVLPYLALAMAAAFLLANSFSYSDVDLGWHLRLGQTIISQHQAPQVNTYNYTLFGQAWVDHEWLLNALMFLVFRIGNFLSLHLFFILVLLLAAYLAWRRSLELSNISLSSKYISAVILFLGLLASRPHLGVRVQEFSWLGLAFLFYLLSSYQKHRRYLWFLPLVFLLWANIHGSFILGLVLLGSYFIYSLLTSSLRRFSFFHLLKLDNFSKRDQWQLLLVFVLSLAATFINPYGLGLYSFLGTYANTVYMTYIREWQGQFIFPLFYSQLIYLAVAGAAMVVWFWSKERKNENLSWWDASLILLFFILAFQSRRHFPIFVIVSLPVLSLFCGSFLTSLGNIWQGNKKVLLPVLVIILTGTLIWQLQQIPWQQNSILDFCERKYPCAATEYLQTHPATENQRLFNEYDWGGYLLWAYPEKPLFIDGRMPQTNYKNHTILEEYLLFRKPDSDIGQLLAEHKIDLVLIRRYNSSLSLHPWEELFFQVKAEELIISNPLKEYLENSSVWVPVFKDKLSIIYQRHEN